MTTYDPEQGYNVRRCGICSINWPDTDDYKRCPQCDEKTKRIGNAHPTHESDQEARSARLHMEFEHYFEEWDAKHRAEEDARRNELVSIAEAGITDSDLDVLGGS